MKWSKIHQRGVGGGEGSLSIDDGERHRWFGYPVNSLDRGAKSDLTFDLNPHKYTGFEEGSKSDPLKKSKPVAHSRYSFQDVLDAQERTPSPRQTFRPNFKSDYRNNRR